MLRTSGTVKTVPYEELRAHTQVHPYRITQKYTLSIKKEAAGWLLLLLLYSVYAFPNRARTSFFSVTASTFPLPSRGKRSTITK